MKRTLKKLFALALTLALAVMPAAGLSLTASAAVVDSGTCGTNVTWSLDDGGVLTISGTGDMNDWEDDRQRPWFSNLSAITSVDIRSGVTSIGEWAFGDCNNLTSVTIPNGVTSIGNNAFRVTDLTSVIIPDSVTSLGESAFYYCQSLETVDLGTGVTSIDNCVFQECTSLSSITIPNSVTSIGSGAFDGCTSLTSITIPNSVTSIGNGAFDGCTGLTITNNSSTLKTVTFDANGGTGYIAPAFKNGTYNLPANGFTAPDGKQFKCWLIDTDEKAVGDSITVSDNITVKAVWEDIPTYTVTFKYNDGTTADTAVTTSGGKVTLPAPSREGYTFGGWFDNEACTGTAVSNDTIFAGNVTLFAKWTENSSDPTPAPTPDPDEPDDPTPEPDPEPEPAPAPVSNSTPSANPLAANVIIGNAPSNNSGTQSAVTATTVGSKAVLGWKAVKGAEKYNIYLLKNGKYVR